VAIVAFDEVWLRSLFPQFEAVPQARLELYFDTASLLVGNTDDGFIRYDPDAGVMDRKTIMGYATCHVATLAAWGEDGQSGPVASAAEGSVNVSFSAPPETGKPGDWWNLTPCGKIAWEYIKRRIPTGPMVVGGRRDHPWG
jgi:hypothetical protein